MAGRNKPAGIRSLVYGMSKGKAVIEGLSVSCVFSVVRAVQSAKSGTSRLMHKTQRGFLSTFAIL